MPEKPLHQPTEASVSRPICPDRHSWLHPLQPFISSKDSGLIWLVGCEITVSAQNRHHIKLLLTSRLRSGDLNQTCLNPSSHSPSKAQLWGHILGYRWVAVARNMDTYLKSVIPQNKIMTLQICHARILLLVCCYPLDHTQMWCAFCIKF